MRAEGKLEEISNMSDEEITYWVEFPLTDYIKWNNAINIEALKRGLIAPKEDMTFNFGCVSD
jgi:hypothetical protein